MKILLAVDGSEASRGAIDALIARQWPARSTIDVITVVEPTHLWSTSETAKAAFQESAEILRGTLERLRLVGLDADGDVLQGDPKTAILNRAEETKANLIVVGSNKVSAVEHFLLGNVAANILRHAPCSVFVARSKPQAGAFKVLIATDGSSFSEAAVRSVASRPWLVGTEFRVLSVVELVLPTAQALFEPPLVESQQIEELRESAMQHTQSAVAMAVAKLSPKFPDVSESISVLLDGPRKIILDEAKHWGADLIVLGSHGRTGTERFLLGSVSEGVATHAPCSVEVIRAAD